MKRVLVVENLSADLMQNFILLSFFSAIQFFFSQVITINTRTITQRKCKLGNVNIYSSIDLKYFGELHSKSRLYTQTGTQG